MIIQSTEYTYEEASHLLGVSLSTLKKAITLGNIRTIRHRGSARKYITQEEIDRVQGKSLLTKAGTDENESLVIKLPRGSFDGILQHINESFKALSNDQVRIASQYRETVTPIVNSVVSTDEQAFMSVLQEATQTMLNNMLRLLQASKYQQFTLEQLVLALTEGLGTLPPDFMPTILEYGKKVYQSYQIEQGQSEQTPA